MLSCGTRAWSFQSQSIEKVTFVQNSRVYSNVLYGLLFKYQVMMDWALIISVTMKKRERTCRFYEIGFRNWILLAIGIPVVPIVDRFLIIWVLLIMQPYNMFPFVIMPWTEIHFVKADYKCMNMFHAFKRLKFVQM